MPKKKESFALAEPNASTVLLVGDFTGWEQYPILNVPFERLGSIAR